LLKDSTIFFNCPGRFQLICFAAPKGGQNDGSQNVDNGKTQWFKKIKDDGKEISREMIEALD